MGKISQASHAPGLTAWRSIGGSIGAVRRRARSAFRRIPSRGISIGFPASRRRLRLDHKRRCRQGRSKPDALRCRCSTPDRQRAQACARMHRMADSRAGSWCSAGLPALRIPSSGTSLGQLSRPDERLRPHCGIRAAVDSVADEDAFGFCAASSRRCARPGRRRA